MNSSDLRFRLRLFALQQIKMYFALAALAFALPVAWADSGYGDSCPECSISEQPAGPELDCSCFVPDFSDAQYTSINLNECIINADNTILGQFEYAIPFLL